MSERTQIKWITECPDPSRWAARIFESIETAESGCWSWLRSIDRHGYGRFRVSIDGRKRQMSAHRASWLAIRGPIPFPLLPDHLCRNRSCVNPDHMELVDNAENCRRGETGKALKGLKGCGTHGMTEGRVATYGGVRRWVCRPCETERRERWRARQEIARA